MMHLVLSELAKETGARILSGDPSLIVTSFSTDTRKLKHGDFFIALKGPNFDGNSFLPEAFAKGAVGAIASLSTGDLSIPSGKCCLLVKDTEKALGDIGALWRRKKNPLVLDVMGSSGKTTTKEMIAHVTSPRYHVIATQANYNNTIGVPLTLFAIDERTQLVVAEIGMNSPGEMFRLGHMTDPDLLVVTNIGRAHIGMFGSREKLIRAKAEIFPVIREDCVLVTNADCAGTAVFLGYARYKHHHVTFGIEEKADVRAGNMQLVNGGAYEFDLVIHQEKIARIRIPLLGRYNVYNALATLAALYAMGADLQDAGDWFLDFTPAKMRSETFSLEGIRIIADCYNANPDSVTQALLSLRDLESEGRILVALGNMLELGEESENIHREIGTLFADLNVELLVTFGDQARLLGEEAASYGQRTRHAQTHEEASCILADQLRKGDTLLIKGSRMMKMELVMQKLVELLRSDVLVSQESKE